MILEGMNDHWNTSLQGATRQKLDAFAKLRGRSVRPGQFWDVVIITAADDRQRAAYELQVAEKLQRKELPLGLPYHVFADPPGPKIGNGGSTLYSLQQIQNKYGDKVRGFRVILIHAGGYSQRLPSASALGKIFTALPLGEPLYQMLELKLAMYIDFPSRMQPGVLVTCADDIELYSVKGGGAVAFDRPGFTALAHPSTLSTGTAHGVFVLEPAEGSEPGDLEYRSCRRFLHKPSVQEMHSSGAVCSRAAGGTGAGGQWAGRPEFVYTDSTYYVDPDTAGRLLGLLAEIGPLGCEIDAYGDFLQALGSGATSAYTTNTTNVTKEERNLVEVRGKIFDLLEGTPLNVILLNNSKFYHIGTTQEYLFHLTGDPNLRAELGLLSDAFSVCPADASKNPAVCIIHSVLHPACTVGLGSVIEYSRLGPNVTVGGNTVISSCWIEGDFNVPSDAFIHSLSLSVNRATFFVTIAFAVGDNLKQSVPSVSDIGQLQFYGRSLLECLGLWGLSVQDLQFSGDTSCLSLWTAKIFPLCCDLKSSFKLSLNMITSLQGRSSFTFPEDVKLFSLQEALQCKDLEEMLKFRKELHRDISEEKLKQS